jgi:hypothetical protein
MLLKHALANMFVFYMKQFMKMLLGVYLAFYFCLLWSKIGRRCQVSLMLCEALWWWNRTWQFPDKCTLLVQHFQYQVRPYIIFEWSVKNSLHSCLFFFTGVRSRIQTLNLTNMSWVVYHCATTVAGRPKLLNLISCTINHYGFVMYSKWTYFVIR